jgi:hypothetical protein
MRRRCPHRTLPHMEAKRLILEASLERSVIRGTLITPSGERRAFHGWLELNAAIEGELARELQQPTVPERT